MSISSYSIFRQKGQTCVEGGDEQLHLLSKEFDFVYSLAYAKDSNTARHLAEFWMIEPEMAFADLAADMDNAEAPCMETSDR